MGAERAPHAITLHRRPFPPLGIALPNPSTALSRVPSNTPSLAPPPTVFVYVCFLLPRKNTGGGRQTPKAKQQKRKEKKSTTTSKQKQATHARKPVCSCFFVSSFFLRLAPASRSRHPPSFKSTRQCERPSPPPTPFPPPPQSDRRGTGRSTRSEMEDISYGNYNTYISGDASTPTN